MRLFIFLTALTLLSVNSQAQSTRRPKSVVLSTTSNWQKVTFKQTATKPEATAPPATNLSGGSQPDVPQPAIQPTPTPASVVPASTPVPTPRKSNNPLAVPAPEDAPPPTATTPREPTFHPAFTGDFATNRNGWKAGNKGDYNYQIGLGRYNIRKRNINTQQVAFSYVPLPADITLNTADMFTIKLDVLADSGRIPTGGLMFGIKDSLNFCAFTINGKGEASIVRVTNGETFSDYMPGNFFSPGVPVDKNRNRLTIRRKGNALHFYINELEVRGSPYPFRMFDGNSIGMLTSAYWTSFQKLSVTLGQ